MKNRVLRFFKRPEGAYHGSVFFQLSGGIGPSCLALDAQGSLYIGQFETRCKSLLRLLHPKCPCQAPHPHLLFCLNTVLDSAATDGIVYVVSPQGKEVATILVEGPEISGLVVRSVPAFNYL
jgi:hypothetical protein